MRLSSIEFRSRCLHSNTYLELLDENPTTAIGFVLRELKVRTGVVGSAEL
jgi:hypothetical protein